MVYSEELRKEVEIQLADVGKRLTKLPSSNDELLALLETAETVLSKVWQDPPKSTADALSPTMQAIVADKLLRHSDVNVQATLASCLSEIIRITVPDAPYPEELMKEIFQLFMVVLKHLPSGSGRNYLRAEWILLYMAVVKYCLIMLDLELDATVVEMFQLFFDTLRSNQSDRIVKYMEIIMTMMINESEEVSVELLTPLLDSVRMENKNISPVSWKLGQTVFENCATQLPDYLREAVKLLNLDVNDYADIVATICNDTSNGENMVEEEVAADGPFSQEVSDDEVSKSEGISEQIVQLEGDSARSNAEVLDNEETVQPEMEETGVLQRRSRKPNTLMRPEEGYEHSWMIGWSIHQRSRSYKKESKIILDNDSEQTVKPRRKIQKSGVKEIGTSMSKRTTKKVIARSRTVSLEMREGSHSGADADDKDELLLQEPNGRKEINDEIISQNNESEDDADKMVDSPVSRPASEDSAPEKEKAQKSGVDYGEELVNARISVWWPLDNAFYTGTIESFDPLTKKHKINYDDDEEEILNLEEEQWEFFNERNLHQIQTSQEHEADYPSRPEEPIKTEKKTSRRKARMSKPQRAASSSKRAKTEGHSFLKSGNSTFRYINLNEDSEDNSF